MRTRSTDRNMAALEDIHDAGHAPEKTLELQIMESFREYAMSIKLNGSPCPTCGTAKLNYAHPPRVTLSIRTQKVVDVEPPEADWIKYFADMAARPE